MSSITISNKLESLLIKRNSQGRYNLYGLMWYNIVKDDRPVYLVSIKSNDLRWSYNIDMVMNHERITVRGGKDALKDHLLSSTKSILHNFTFENVMTEDVFLELTILNDGKDGFMKYNIYEGLNDYTVKVNLAGVKKEEVRVVLQDGIIKVKTNPKIQVEEDMDVKLEMFEPVKSETEIYLPNITSVNARLEDGILILTAPKESKGVKVEIE